MTATRRFFVTGTNTEVGKTVVTRAIAGALASLGLRVAALKPVESGVLERPEDATALGAASSPPQSAEAVSLYTFRDPVSPHLAAKQEGRQIEEAPILQFLARWSEKTDVIIAEGAGGLLVPLSERLLYADLIAKTGFALIIVAPNVLGTINATLLTIEAARARQIPIAGVILNGTPQAELGNRAAIAVHGYVPVLGTFPRVAPTNSEMLTDAVKKHIDLAALMSAS